MPTFSAVKFAPYPLDTSFKLITTVKNNPPEYGFHFRLPKTSRGRLAFDDCESYDRLYDPASGYSPNYLLLRYELLFKHPSGHLSSKFYIVPWILMPSKSDLPRTLTLIVSPLSIYDAAISKRNKDDLKDKIGLSTRTVDLVSTTDQTIEVFWNKSGNETSIKESSLKVDTEARIEVPPGEYHGVKEIEIRTNSNIILGKARISFYDTLAQPICFMKIDSSGNQKYTATLLSPEDVPKSFEDGTRLDVAANASFKPYGIDLETIENAVFLDGKKNVLISTQKKFEFNADLTPDENLASEQKAIAARRENREGTPLENHDNHLCD